MNINVGNPIPEDEVEDNSTGSLKLRFKKFIKVSRSRQAYGSLELLAEVGGYVGLFLGISINQLFVMGMAFYEKSKKIYGSCVTPASVRNDRIFVEPVYPIPPGKF